MPETLARVPLFRGIALDGLAALRLRGAPRTCAAGEVLLQQGDTGTSMFVIEQGRVRVLRQQPGVAEPLELAVVGPGGVVGEIGMLDGLPRTATVIAATQTVVLELPAGVVAEVMLRYPSAAVALLRTVSTRLRNTDELVAWCKENADQLRPPGTV